MDSRDRVATKPIRLLPPSVASCSACEFNYTHMSFEICGIWEIDNRNMWCDYKGDPMSKVPGAAVAGQRVCCASEAADCCAINTTGIIAFVFGVVGCLVAVTFMWCVSCYQKPCVLVNLREISSEAID